MEKYDQKEKNYLHVNLFLLTRAHDLTYGGIILRSLRCYCPFTT